MTFRLSPETGDFSQVVDLCVKLLPGIIKDLGTFASARELAKAYEDRSDIPHPHNAAHFFYLPQDETDLRTDINRHGDIKTYHIDLLIDHEAVISIKVVKNSGRISSNLRYSAALTQHTGQLAAASMYASIQKLERLRRTEELFQFNRTWTASKEALGKRFVEALTISD